MLYSCAFRTTISAQYTAICELNTTSTQSCKIMEVGVITAAGTATSIALGYPSGASSGGPAFLVNGTGAGFWPEQDTGASGGVTPTNVAKTTITIYSSGTAATCSTTVSPMFRRTSMSAAIGQGLIWTFPRGLYMPASSTGTSAICLFNIVSAAPVMDCWFVIDE